jgi:hypothetical protein
VSWAVVAVVEAGGGGGVNWSVVAALAGIVAVVATIFYGEIQRRMAGKQLRLAQEEAALRPKLSVSLKQITYQSRPREAEWPHDKASIVFDLKNVGRSAAHAVRCEVRLDKRHFAPDDMNIAPHPYSGPHLGPSDKVAVPLNVDVLHYGPTEAHYVCACDEVGESEGTIKFEIHERRTIR